MIMKLIKPKPEKRRRKNTEILQKIKWNIESIFHHGSLQPREASPSQAVAKDGCLGANDVGSHKLVHMEWLLL